MSETLANTTVGDIVAADFRAAGVFERYGIDFCCGGRQSLGEACRDADASPEAVIRDLQALPAAAGSADDMTAWSASSLIEYIESTHHTYVRAAIPRIGGFVDKLVEVHGARHPELAFLAAAFQRLAVDLIQHMRKEERVLFPFIRDLEEHQTSHLCSTLLSPFGSVENPIRMMEHEHRDAGDELAAIRELTGGYVTPADGCTTYRVCMSELQAFERDLHRHIHIENNILFPKAVAMEEQQRH